MNNKKKYDEFHREIGQLVFWFSLCENSIYMIANALIRDDIVSGIVLKNFHLEKAIDITRELAKARYPNSPHLSSLDSAFLEFKKCAQDRNALLHSTSLPIFDLGAGEDVIHLTSARSMKTKKFDRRHITELQERIREVAGKFLQAAIDMKIPRKKTKISPK